MEKQKKVIKPSRFKNWWTKVAILAAVNLVCAVGTLILQANLAAKAQELKKARVHEINTDLKTNEKAIEEELVKLEEKYTKILPVFPTVDTILDFINLKESLVTNGEVKSFTFAGEGVIKDRLGLGGLPVLAEAEGDINKINQALTKIGSMPYLIREIKIELGQEATGSYKLRYGGFLYTDENFTQN
ncbi:MAG: hypothetical protein US96_C0053G0006 [Candidatus Woesebacteria bacterium GW2011_GWB1_38_5b]|uniref:Uncharacterized protein n=1 Tax=Candidatus Woesebacteria bacterium GW2011_GWB1_38_5b TaxID=1618569 RepID=A0A0G0KE57_9BACT|nr:MAG: hypothetical protein US96_C0053G0006 [Candidatus Woesebacteria bacterium GW2011_GWB1_38_5b]